MYTAIRMVIAIKMEGKKNFCCNVITLHAVNNYLHKICTLKKILLRPMYYDSEFRSVSAVLDTQVC